MRDGDFRGTPELEFSPEEAAAILAAEGRPIRRADRPVHEVQPHNSEGGSRGFVVAALLLSVMVLPFLASLDSRAPSSGPPVPAAAAAAPVPQPRALTRTVPPAPLPPASGCCSAPLPLPTADHAKPAYTAGPVTPEVGAVSGPTLPPGWDAGMAGEDLKVSREPQCGAHVIAPLARGTGFLFKRLALANPCWHVLVTEDGAVWGYTCLVPGARPRPVPLPPEWISAPNEGLPLRLFAGQGSNLVIGIVPAGTTAVVRRLAHSDSFFVISPDGRSWGYAESRGGSERF